MGFLVDTLPSVKSLVTDNCIIIIILKLIKLLSLQTLRAKLDGASLILSLD